MAGSGSSDFCGNWWGGWLQAAKEKSTAALDMVRKDLAEFGCTMQKDTSHAVEVTSTTLKESLTAENTSTAKEKLTKGLNTFLEGISKAIAVPPDDEGQIPVTASSIDLYDRTKARLHAIQVDPETYLSEPDGSPEEYSRWCESFDLDSAKGEISELLVSKAEVRGLYTKLVPSRVSHVDFWRHYFYKRHQIDLEQARKEALMKRAERSRADNSFSWEDDWSGDEMAEDSGSDWEKLPRPNQRNTPTPPMPVGPTAPASEATPDGPSSEQRTGPGNAAQSGVEPFQTSPAAGSPQMQSVTLQETHPGRADVSAAKGETVTPEKTNRNVFTVHPQADEALSVPVEETPGVSSVRHGREERLDGHDPPPSGGSKAEQSAECHQTDDPTSVLPNTFPAGASLLLGQDCTKPCLQVEPENKPVELENDQVVPVNSQVEQISSQVGHDSDQPEQVSGKVESEGNNVEPVTSQGKPFPSEDEPVTSKDEPAASPAPEVATSSITNKSEAAVLSMKEPEQFLQGRCEVAHSEDSVTGTADQKEASVLTTDHGYLASASPAAADGVLATALEDDWDQDLDIELTEDDMKTAEELAKRLGQNVNLEEDDWENWE